MCLSAAFLAVCISMSLSIHPSIAPSIRRSIHHCAGMTSAPTSGVRATALARPTACASANPGPVLAAPARPCSDEVVPCSPSRPRPLPAWPTGRRAAGSLGRLGAHVTANCTLSGTSLRLPVPAAAWALARGAPWQPGRALPLAGGRPGHGRSREQAAGLLEVCA